MTNTTNRIPPVIEPGRARFRNFAWGVLAYNLAVVLWGAYVRATGSGAGCGGHWPLCNGGIVPRAPQLATVIEYTHRLTSGLALVAVAALVVSSFHLFPRASRVRRAAVSSMAFLLAEALLGAGLVLFGYVAQDESPARAAYLSLHLANTLLLLGALAATAWLSGRPKDVPVFVKPPALLWAALAAVLVAAITGTLAALGDTLHPAASIAAGVRQEFSSAATFLVRLRGLHPLLAVGAGLYILFTVSSAVRGKVCSGRTASFAAALVVLQLAAGAVNIMLLAPVWMQIVHLLIAALLWISLCLLLLETAEAAPTASGPTAETMVR